MLFHSEAFFYFLPIAFFVYWLLPNNGLRKWWLLAASCWFYMSWNAIFVLLIAFSAGVDFFSAQALTKISSSKWRKAIVFGSICVNLGLLGYFKYSNFFIDNVCAMLHSLGFSAHKPVLELILPLGISFYTFETISYIVDVYLGRVQACKNFASYALFIMFFPHLIAGPIVRARDFLPQVEKEKRFSWLAMAAGTQLFIVGLFKKVVIADNLARFVDPVFQNPASHSTSAVWLAALFYTIQIFCDFSGYSDMALGLARMFGYKLKINFNNPYLATDLVDFWRRWHISLSSWIRDYLYIPLGGGKKGRIRKHANLLATMLICGFWHGANWQFVLWGAYHGILLFLTHLYKEAKLNLSVPKFITMSCTFVLVLVGWVIFRAHGIDNALAMYGQMFSFKIGSSPAPYLMFTSLVSLGFFVVYQMLAATNRLKTRRLSPAVLAFTFSSLALSILLFRPEEKTSFIYFQF